MKNLCRSNEIELLRRDEAISQERSSFQVSVSMLEIYDEKVIDLLSGGKEPLPIREDQSGSVFVSFELVLKGEEEII